jgi:hypothetical protein
MLLDLFNHHEDIFHAAIRPLIWRRDCRSLATLGTSCRQMRDFLAAEVPFWGHFLRMRRCINAINRINIINNKYITLKENNGKLLVISYWNYKRHTISCNSCSLTTFHSEYLLWYIGHKRKIISMKYNKVIMINDNGYIVKYTHMKIIGAIPEWLLKYINNDYILLSDTPEPKWTFKIE